MFKGEKTVLLIANKNAASALRYAKWIYHKSLADDAYRKLLSKRPVFTWREDPITLSCFLSGETGSKSDDTNEV